MAERTFELKFLTDAKQALGGLKSVEGGMSRLGKVAFAGAIVGGLGAIGKAAFDVGADFDQAYDTIRAGTGATGDVLKGLERDFRQTFRSVPDDMQAVATAIADINTQLGLKGEDLQKATKQSLDLQRVFGDDAQAVIKDASDALGLFREPPEAFVGFLDRLTVASQMSGASVSVLSADIVKFGPTLHAAGFDLSEATALIAGLNAAGVETAPVFAGLNKVMAKLAKEGVTDIKGALLGQIDAIKNASSEAEALNLASQLFGTKGGPAMLAAIRSGTFDFRAFTAAMADSDGVLADLAEDSLTLGERFQRMKNNVLVSLEPALTALFKTVEGVFRAFESLPQPLQTVIVAIIAVAAAAAALAAVFGPIVALLAGPLLGALAALFIGSAAPFVIAAIVIAALIAAGILLITHWDEVKLAAAQLGQFLGDQLGGPFIFVRDRVQDLIDKLGELKRALTDLPGLGDIPLLGGAAKGLGLDLNPIDIAKGLLNPTGLGAQIGKSLIGQVGRFGFAHGGVVPGARGSPQLIMAHGGETVLPTHRMAGGGMSVVVNVQGNTMQSSAELQRIMIEALTQATQRGNFGLARA